MAFIGLQGDCSPAFCSRLDRPKIIRQFNCWMILDLIILSMSELIAIVGVSGVGKTALVSALAKASALSAVEGFDTAYEQHIERPFQSLFKSDARYALANQIDYFLLRAEQERKLRASPQIGLIDGGLDLDFYGFTRLFHKRGLLTDPEFELCQRLYGLIREHLPFPELIIRLYADESTIANRLSGRDRINIATAEDTALFDLFLDQWLDSIPSEQKLELDVTNEILGYENSIGIIFDRIKQFHNKP